MDLVTKYIMDHSDGCNSPVRGSQIAAALGVSGIEVRRIINTARGHGDLICSNTKGYYIAQDKEAVQRTIDSLNGRIAAMSRAVKGLEATLKTAVFETGGEMDEVA